MFEITEEIKEKAGGKVIQATFSDCNYMEQEIHNYGEKSYKETKSKFF